MTDAESLPAARGTRNDSVRRENLSAVVELVHRSGGLSRASLTTATGLNRSTIAALVAELVDAGVVVEATADPTNRVGRPSPRVLPGASSVTIAVNPEVDAITLAIVGLSGRVDSRVRHEMDHPASPEEVALVVAELVARLADDIGDRRIVGVGLAGPGGVRSRDGLVRWAPHLQWTDAPLTALVERATGLPARVDNDASLGALAEHRFGAGRGVDNLVYLNGGASGIGGGVIVNGSPLAGASGYAGEFGQNRPGVGDPADRVTADGTLEDEVSRARLLDALGLAGTDEATLTQALLTSTSPAVLAEIERQRRILAVALSNAVNVLNPSLVVLGGFLADLREADSEAFDSLVGGQAVAAAWADVRILPAELGADRLLIGAAELAFASLLADPASKAQ